MHYAYPVLHLVASGSSSSIWQFSANSAELESSVLPFPTAAVRIMQAGWNEHIPLTALTNAACEHASGRPSHFKDVIKLDKGALRIQGSYLDDSKEPWLSITEWLEASQRLLQLIRSHFPILSAREVIAAAFAVHFVFVQTKASLSTQPGLAMRYDLLIRRKFAAAADKFDPAKPQYAWWDDLVREFSLGIIKGTFDANGYRLPYPPGVLLLPPASHSVITASHTSTPVYPSRRDSHRFSSTASMISSKPSSDSFRCFLCGQRGSHTARSCSALPLYLRKVDGRFLDPAGASICFGFNAKQCNRSPCSHAHSCSLCGDKGHGAQRCSRV